MKIQKGIGLLELLLAFSIIAVLLISATRYYQAAQDSRKIQLALDTVQAVYYAGEQYVENVGQLQLNNNIESFKQHGYLPDNFSASDNPWGGDITAVSAAETSSTKMKMTLTNITLSACKKLTAKVASSKFIDPRAVVSDCGTSSPATIEIIFSDYMAAS